MFQQSFIHKNRQQARSGPQDVVGQPMVLRLDQIQVWFFGKNISQVTLWPSIRSQRMLCGVITSVCSMPRSIISLGAGTSLMVQWLRICLAMQGTGSLPSQGTKVPHAMGVTKPVSHNYWARAFWSLNTTTREPSHCKERSHMIQWRPNQPNTKINKIFLKIIRGYKMASLIPSSFIY